MTIINDGLPSGRLFLFGATGMIKPTKDHRQSDQSVEDSEDKINYEKKDFDPVEYYTKRLKDLGIETKKMDPPKDRVLIWFKR